jgi:hypothetical protein
MKQKPDLPISCVLVLAGLLAFFCGCEDRSDRDAMDSLLATGNITQVEASNLRWTNSLNGADVKKLLARLDRTNRASAWGSKDQLSSTYILLNGTNAVGRVDEYDDGTWEFGHYVFHVK